MSEFPKEYQTNKNLRYWLSNRPDEEICSSPDDFFLHETEVVEFAKQFHSNDIQTLESELGHVKDLNDSKSETIQRLESEIKKRDDLLREALRQLDKIEKVADEKGEGMLISGYGLIKAIVKNFKIHKPEIKAILEEK